MKDRVILSLFIGCVLLIISATVMAFTDRSDIAWLLAMAGGAALLLHSSYAIDIIAALKKKLRGEE